MFALGNSSFACGVRSAHERSFEEARGETEVGRRRLPPPLAPEPRPLPPMALAPRTRPAGPPVRKSNPNLNQRPPWALFCQKLDNSCCYTRYGCGNNCNVVVEFVQEYHCFLIHFTSVLWRQFATNDTFRREANSYKRALALRNSRQMLKQKARLFHYFRRGGDAIRRICLFICLSVHISWITENSTDTFRSI